MSLPGAFDIFSQGRGSQSCNVAGGGTREATSAVFQSLMTLLGYVRGGGQVMFRNMRVREVSRTV